MSQNTPEIMEADIGNSNYNTKIMNSEDNEEVQYVYEESQMVLGEADDFNNITDLILEDGTRAMIVNGTLVTADGQTLILQDGSDLSQYYVDDNTDEILLSQEEEEQFLGIISPQNNSQAEEEAVVEYVRGENTATCNREEILYMHEGDQVIPVQKQYQLAESHSENAILPIQQVIEGMDDVIDLEQLLNQQGLLQVEAGNNYQYAILKDGKFHIQTINEPTNVEIVKHRNTSNVNDESLLEPSAESSYLNFSLINDKFGGYNSPASSVGLKNLINKKMIIGKTDKGKLLIGKIINVTKKTDASNNTFKNKKSSTIKKKITVPLKNKKNKLNLALKDEVINLVDDDETEELHNNNACVRTSDPKISPESDQNNDTNLLPLTSSNTEWSERSNNSPVTLQSNSAPNILSAIAENGDDKIPVKKDSELQDSTRDQNSSHVGSSPEQSKIVVHKKVVTKDCFEVITRTLTGLMNMESVVKKLKNKTIIIKIIEKNYDQDADEYSKSVSYCTGYMVREYQLNDTANSFSESWRFIPDANSQDTILGEDNLEAVFPDPVTGQNSLKRIANLTIQITVNSQGSRTTRVIINPPNMYKCKECSKSFRTSSALKVHTNDYHSPVSLECTACSIKFKNHQDYKEHSLRHQVDNNEGMYECMECNKRFGSSLKLRRHMDIHFKATVNCRHCNQSFSSMRDLKRHLPIHEPVLPEPTSVPAILRKGPYDTTEDLNSKPYEQKIYCCHICGRQFSRHSNLQRHIEIHQGEGAMYKCAICSCSYHYVSSLTRHVVTCHVDKTNKQSQKNIEVKQEESHPKSDLQFVEENASVEMMQLEDISVENVHYVHVAENLSMGEGVEVLQIPGDEESIVIDD